MDVSRHGSGATAALRAAASQVHPVFMLPPVAASLFGGFLAGRVELVPAALHVVAVFAGLYVAHVKDGYVDFHVRGEDDDHPLTADGCRLLLALGTVAFALPVAALGVVVGIGAVLVSLPGWLVGYHHAPQLDTNPVTATTGYPLGVAVALLGGYYVQAGALAPLPLALAALFLVLLSGIKVVDDATDHDYDRSIAKRTVAVALGVNRARQVANGLFAVGVVGVATLAVAGPLPPSAAVATAPFAAVAYVAHRADPELATMLLIRGSYVFLAVLVAAVWFRPLA